MNFFGFWWSRKRERELAEEISSHLRMALEDRVRRGEPLNEAKGAVLREFGNVGLVKEVTRSVSGWKTLESIGKDARYAFRILNRSRGFAVISVLALALGIGANSAIYSVVHSVLLSPLPFTDSQQLVRLWDSFGSPDNYAPVSYPTFRDWRAWNRSFSDMAAYGGASYVLTGAGEATHIEGVIASASLFNVLKVQPSLGRAFLPEEDRPAANNGADSIILSNRLWKERFGQTSSILGRVLLLDGKPFAVVGVMPAGFNSYTGGDRTDFWVTTAVLAEPSSGSAKPVSEEREISFLNVTGRLKPGASIKQAQSDMDRVASMLMRAYPNGAPKEGVIVRDLRESITGNIRPILLLLFGAAGTVLAITCANIAGLMSARITRRHREMNIRAAIGAGRLRIVRQLFVESLLISSIGLGLGLWFAAVTARYLRLLLDLPGQPGPALDFAVFGFGAAIAFLAALVLSIAPATHVLKADLIHGLKESALTTSESGRQRRLQRSLMIAQIAFATVLLSASSLFTLGLIRLQKIDLGFEPKHTLSFPTTLAETKYSQSQRASVFQELESRLNMLPGVRSVGAGSQLPLQGNISNTTLDKVGGRAIPERERTGITYAVTSGDYFKALGIRVRAGRVFTAADTGTSQPVVVINYAAARKYFGSRNPVGEQIEPVMWNGSGSTTRPRTIVGVVGDVKLQGIGNEANPTVYWPILQIPSSDTLYVVMRTKGDALQLLPSIRTEIHALDRNLPLYDVQPLTEFVRGSLAEPLHITALVSTFGILAVLLIAIGVFGVVAYNIAQRTREIAVRMALGAQRKDILRDLLMQAVLPSGIGLAFGLLTAAGTARFLRGSFFGVPAQEPMSLTLAGLALLGVILSASFFPALRATRVDPMTALRYG
jgi:predicted permease